MLNLVKQLFLCSWVFKNFYLFLKISLQRDLYSTDLKFSEQITRFSVSRKVIHEKELILLCFIYFQKDFMTIPFLVFKVILKTSFKNCFSLLKLFRSLSRFTWVSNLFDFIFDAESRFEWNKTTQHLSGLFFIAFHQLSKLKQLFNSQLISYLEHFLHCYW